MAKRKLHLRYVGLEPRTLRAYRLALDNFLKFSKQKRLKCVSPKRLDYAVSEFINHSYQEGDPISYAGHLLSAIKRFHPEFKLKLPLSSQLYRNWVRAYTPVRATPASWELVEAMIGNAMAQGQSQLGLLLGLAFHCMLRTSEMLALTHAHVMVHDSQKALSVVLPKAKTSVGNPQVLQVDDPTLVNMAVCVVRRRKKADLLWPGSHTAFRTAFQNLLGKLGFPVGSYLPYSLRRGGATWYYQATLSLDATVVRGRWSCSKTARSYIDSGTLQLAHLTWSSNQTRLVQKWRLKGARLRLRQAQKDAVLTECLCEVSTFFCGNWND